MSVKPSIDIFIPFYMYFNDVHRYNFTKIIFKHMSELRKKLSDKAVITFTLLGSEGNRSKNLALQFFDKSEYFEFDQNTPEFQSKDFYFMFDKKIKKGIQICKSKGTDICLWMGSNDFIPKLFFEQVIAKFLNNGRNEPQMYGIDNYKNGKNAVFFATYNGNDNSLDINNQAFWWSGLSSAPRDVFSYTAGIIGFNKFGAEKYPEIITNWHYDEGEDERMMTQRGFIKLTTNECFYLNIKMLSKTELHSYERLYNYYYKFILNFTDFNSSFRDYVNAEVFYLLSLLKDINNF